MYVPCVSQLYPLSEEYRTPFFLGNSKPSLNALQLAVPRLANQWRELGLGLGAENFSLDNIQRNHVGELEVTQKCCSVMLQNWINGKPDCGNCPRTWNALLQKVQGVVGSEASDFIKRKILNWKEDGALIDIDTTGSEYNVNCFFVSTAHANPNCI